MKYSIKIKNITIIDEIEGAWTTNDFVQLLEKFEYPDAKTIKETELKEYLFMAISDFEPAEAAAILLDYKLGDALNEGQIDSLSHEMTFSDKVSEEYPVVELHHDLFNINQLYISLQWHFCKCKSCIIDFEIKPINQNEVIEITKEIVLKTHFKGLFETFN